MRRTQRRRVIDDGGPRFLWVTTANCDGYMKYERCTTFEIRVSSSALSIQSGAIHQIPLAASSSFELFHERSSSLEDAAPQARKGAKGETCEACTTSYTDIIKTSKGPRSNRRCCCGEIACEQLYSL